MKKLKRIGWVGYSDNQPFFEPTADDWTELAVSIPTIIVFKTKTEALKIFEDVRQVLVASK